MKSLLAKVFRFLPLLCAAASTSLSSADSLRPNVASPGHPNIIIILADDLGYGDVGCYGATKVSTPNIDQLARGGLRFTDAHCTAATCTPSRYSILTGQYSFRNPKAVILNATAPMLMGPNDPSVPAMLKQAGYATGLVGKWHLGVGDGKVDWNGTIAPGPDETGFDYCFYFAATPDRVPCVYIENHQIVNLTSSDPLSINYQHKIGTDPTGLDHPELLRYPANRQHSGTIVDHISRIGFMAGGHSAWWVDENMADLFESKAEGFIAQNKNRPFFLYYAPNNVHVPRAPNGRFLHTSACGIRGDSIEELDAMVGKLMADLKSQNLLDHTLIIFSSDNGPIFDDGYSDGSIREANGHQPAGPFRGGKFQIYEGGTRIPFIVSWPGKVAPGVSTALVSQVDLFASLADLVGTPQAAAARPDSVDILPALLGTSKIGLQTMMEQAVHRLALRDGPWKYIPAGADYGVKPGIDGDTTQSPPTPPDLQLYNLDSDISESQNVAAQHPDVVEKMKREFSSLRGSDSGVVLPPGK
jgi:arylsulfatase A-like enzyme